MNPSTAAAQVIIDELVRSGVTDIVLAPGSRSAPLAIEVSAADDRGEVRLHVRVDERTAGFLALGLAKASGAPVPVVTTSGTAAANLRPAMEEAFLSGVPLIAVTADRPAELRQTGASQTIDQVRLFDGVTVWSTDLEAPVRRRGQVAYWRSSISRAVSMARHPWQRGPVHVNAAFRDPLVPDGDERWVEDLAGHDVESFIDGDGDEVEVVRTWAVDRRLMMSVQEPIDGALEDIGVPELPQRGLVIVGDIDDPDDAAAAVALAEACAWPLHSEPTGGARAGSVALAHAALLLESSRFRATHQPELVVTIGKVGLTRGVLAAVAGATHHLHAEPQRTAFWPDPTRTATCVLGAVPGPPEETEVADSSDWLDAWLMADAAAQRAVEKCLADETEATGLHVASALWQHLGPDNLLLVASSRSIRDLEAVATVRPDAPTVMGNRGVNGIDGLISTAWGAALAHQAVDGGTGFLMLGDLAAVHDLTGLIVGAAEPRPELVLVVVDNNGGGIFGSLEAASGGFGDGFERVFGTPLNIDLQAILTAIGVPVVRAGESLSEAFEEADRLSGVRAVLVGPIDRVREAALHRRLRNEVG